MPDFSVAISPKETVKIAFPFQPYECQKTFITSLIKSLRHGKHAILESPTGTGKTLCLLCGALAWGGEVASGNIPGPNPKKPKSNSKPPPVIDDQSSLHWDVLEKKGLFHPVNNLQADLSNTTALPRIVYASRTHSQLSQVVKEFKRALASYNEMRSGSSTDENQNPKQKPLVLKTVVIGSRDQLCCNSTSKRLAKGALNAMCRNLVKNHKCPFHGGLRNVTSSMFTTPRDVEELSNFGESCGFCPFYAAREHQADCSIIFCPYSYILDPQIRSALSLDLSGAVVIIDEAHNIEKEAEEAVSFECSTSSLQLVIQAVDALKSSGDAKISASQATSLLANPVSKVISNVTQAVNSVNTKGKVLEGKDSVDFFTACGLNKDNFEAQETAIQAIIEALATSSRIHTIAMETSKSISACESFLKVLRVLGSDSVHTQAITFRLALEKEEDPEDPDNPNIIMRLWCLSPSPAMVDLVQTCGIHSLIITSGTLSPIPSLASQLTEGYFEFGESLSNGHVIAKEQITCSVVTKGISGSSLSSAYNDRSSKTYSPDLGNLILEISSATIGGILVFFPSYSAMTNMLKSWQYGAKNSTIFERLQKDKTCTVEPRSAAEMQPVLDAYNDGVQASIKSGGRSSTGSILFAVCRGKVSEGIDFSDTFCRCVVIAGVPFPSVADQKVKLKREFLDNQVKHKRGSLGGSQWYLQQAIRSVNQAIGRVVRHVGDFGVVVLADERFTQRNVQENLTSWIMATKKIENDPREIRSRLLSFYNQIPDSLKKEGESATILRVKLSAEEDSLKAKEPIKLSYNAAGEAPTRSKRKVTSIRSLPTRETTTAEKSQKRTKHEPFSQDDLPQRSHSQKSDNSGFELRAAGAIHKWKSTGLGASFQPEGGPMGQRSRPLPSWIKIKKNPHPSQIFEQSPIVNTMTPPVALSTPIQQTPSSTNSSQRTPQNEIADFVKTAKELYPEETYRILVTELRSLKSMEIGGIENQKKTLKSITLKLATGPDIEIAKTLLVQVKNLFVQSSLKEWASEELWIEERAKNNETLVNKKEIKIASGAVSDVDGLEEFEDNKLKTENDKEIDKIKTLDVLEGLEEFEEEDEGTECSICKKLCSKIYEATNCKHRSCYPCWENTLALKLECPFCRQRTRLNHLKCVASQSPSKRTCC
eukprot:GHVP01018392.1.p1 GENE.GHVP01018392.1~~GHVP01018392.1.p1  ORF type:complete len:1161 (-),score=199.38 GHVP01018392.1:636-4118(-)